MADGKQSEGCGGEGTFALKHSRTGACAAIVVIEGVRVGLALFIFSFLAYVSFLLC